MAIVKPFKAVRPSRDKVALVSSKSYDAYTDKELDAKLEFNPFTFLHIITTMIPMMVEVQFLPNNAEPYFCKENNRSQFSKDALLR